MAWRSARYLDIPRSKASRWSPRSRDDETVLHQPNAGLLESEVLVSIAGLLALSPVKTQEVGVSSVECLTRATLESNMASYDMSEHEAYGNICVK